jgi:hypothetical protein
MPLPRPAKARAQADRARTDATTAGFPRRRFPCAQCPIRADTADNPDSQVPPHRWRDLTATVIDPATGYGPDFDASLFGCHMREPGTGADLACAGWLARFGQEHPRVRLALAMGRLPVDALTPGENWPPLHETWPEVVANHSATVHAPPQDACAASVAAMALHHLVAAAEEYERTKAAHAAAYDEVVAQVVAALRAGHRPVEVAAVAPFSDRTIRTIAAKHGLAPAKPGRTPKPKPE